MLKAILHRAETALRILAKLCLLAPILLGMVWFNFRVDRSGLFHTVEYEEKIVAALRAGENLNGYDQMDERRINALYAETLEEPLDTLTLGSSRILQYGAEGAGTQNFYNAGMSGGDFYDMLGTFYLYDRADMLPDTLILQLDAWLLNPSQDAYSHRSDEDLYNEFLAVRLGRGSADAEESMDYSRYTALFDPSYFQASLEYYLQEDTEISDEPSVVMGDLYNQRDNVKMWDGSVLYFEEFRTAGAEEVERRARDEAMTLSKMHSFVEPDDELCAIFEDFVAYALSRDVNVVFLLVPYNPTVYNYALENRHSFTGFFETENWFTACAERYNIPLYGSYNPFRLGCTSADFYDGLHITAEALTKILPDTSTIRIQQKSATANSEWLMRENPVAGGTAYDIVVERYEIVSPHSLRISPDDYIEVDGQQCYLFERYDDSDPAGTLLAQYAVTTEQGVIYRLDTTAGIWVVDSRFVPT